jgi:membrane protease YdiL (CAAX protease family)
MGEEPGWRGFALPRLQTGRSALAASLVLGLIWAGWHLPQFILDDGFNLIAWAPKILSTVTVSVVMAWIFNNTNGSVLMTALLHASYGTIGNQFFFQMFSGTSRVRLDWLDAAFWAIVAVVVVLITGPERLSRRPLEVPVESAPTSKPLARENHA